MREMKNSGIEWIGEIPKDWKLGKAKRFIRITNGSNPTIEGDIPVYGSGKKPFATCGNYKSGSAVLLGRKGTIDNPTYVEGLYWNVDTVFDVKVTRDDFSIKYYYYLSTCFDYKFYMTQTAIPSMTQTNYNNIFIPFPPLNEQTTIASYLDKKCSNIDAIITKHEQIIEKLKEYKSSLITETVTKGLNPDVEMKDSGVEWIGKMPAEWEINKIKYFGIQSAIKANNSSNYIGLENIESGTGKYISSDEEFNPEGAIMQIHAGDVIFGKLRPYLAKCYLVEKSGCASTEFIIITPTKSNGKYLKYIMLSPNFIDVVNMSTYGTKMPRANWDFIGNIQAPFPSLAEQTAIANYLDKKCSIIDSNIAKRKLINAKLAEYKKSLIYEVVTGKKEII